MENCGPLRAVVNTAGIIRIAGTLSDSGEAHPLSLFEEITKVSLWKGAYLGSPIQGLMLPNMVCVFNLGSIKQVIDMGFWFDTVKVRVLL